MLEERKLLLSASNDGTVAVVDIRSQRRTNSTIFLQVMLVYRQVEKPKVVTRLEHSGAVSGVASDQQRVVTVSSSR